MKKLPIGLSTLDKIINNDYLYIDKTQHIVNLANNGGGYYFLSRPRRFGKTLFLDTLKQAFLGNKQLFKGLYLESKWDWSKTHPIVHISFSGGNFSLDGELNLKLQGVLNSIAEAYGINLTQPSYSDMLGELIAKLRAQTGFNVVVLVDEYDKPILDAIDNTPLAIKNREILKGFYGILKDHDANLEFVFVTGVTKFAKSGIFSNLNNLEDITFNSDYADICGYTQNDVDIVFAPYLAGVDLNELKRWYNGYNFLGNNTQKVYNPFDILLFISNHKVYKNYWFETGTPSFLIKLLQKKCYYIPKIEGIKLTDATLGSFDVDNLSIEVLLLQSGYLTIREAVVNDRNMMLYVLDYPNFEVKQSLNDRILNSLFGGDGRGVLNDSIPRIEDILAGDKFDQLEFGLKSLFAGIPYDWYRNNHIEDYEGYYCSIVYTVFNTLGYIVVPEDKTNLGQIDLSLILPNKIVIIEFKMLNNGNSENALLQIKSKRYHEKYLSQNKPIYIIGMVFDGETRNLCEYAWEKCR